MVDLTEWAPGCDPAPHVPGIYEGIPASLYHADPWGPTLSASMAHLLVSRSPAHAYARHPRLGGVSEDEESEAMDAGSVLHGLILGAGAEIVVVEADSWRTNAAKDERDTARLAGKIPILKSRFEQLAETAAEIEKNLVRCLGLDMGATRREVVALWEEGGVKCRALIDSLDLAEFVIRDLKFVRDGAPQSFARTMIANGLDVQWSAYTSAIETLVPEIAGRLTMEFIRCETSPPYAVSRMAPSGSMRSHGGSRWRRAVASWSRCLAADSWPGYPAELQEVGAPTWALEEEMAAASVGDPDWFSGAGAEVKP